MKSSKIPREMWVLDAINDALSIVNRYSPYGEALRVLDLLTAGYGESEIRAELREVRARQTKKNSASSEEE